MVKRCRKAVSVSSVEMTIKFPAGDLQNAVEHLQGWYLPCSISGFFSDITLEQQLFRALGMVWILLLLLASLKAVKYFQFISGSGVPGSNCLHAIRTEGTKIVKQRLRNKMKSAVGWRLQLGVYCQISDIRRSGAKLARVNILSCKASASWQNYNNKTQKFPEGLQKGLDKCGKILYQLLNWRTQLCVYQFSYKKVN